MTIPTTEDAPLDFARQFEPERRSVVQPTIDADESALQPSSVELAPSPRNQCTELVEQPWSLDESSHWRRAPR